jgi:hypothetical protein
MNTEASKSSYLYLQQASRIKEAALHARSAAVRDQLLHLAVLYEKLAHMVLSEPSSVEATSASDWASRQVCNTLIPR